MIREHLEKRENHAHRLWALMVLELWMARHIDGGRAAAKKGTAA